MPTPNTDPQGRYSRQIRFAPLGLEGQQKLAESTAVVLGCGALGSVAADALVRAGVGRVRIVDRDFLEVSNLQRQVLFDERDVAAGLPKAIAAAEKLRNINSEVEVEPVVADATFHNIGDLVGDADVILDGADNFETRLLVNDYAIDSGTPWVYGGCLGAEGQMLPIVPGVTACLSCLIDEPPPPGLAPTCDTAGILGPAVKLVAAFQSIEAIKILVGDYDSVCRRLTVVDMWRNRTRQVDLSSLHPPGACPTCDDRHLPWLHGERGSDAAVLCGRNAVQIRPVHPSPVNLEDLAAKLGAIGSVTSNPFLVRAAVADYELTLFADGRVIVGGVDDIVAARSVVARYLGA